MLAWSGLAISVIVLARYARLRLRTRRSAVTSRKPFVTVREPVARARRAIARARGSVASARKPFATVRESPATAQTSNEAIAAWCHTVDPENTPLLPHTEVPQMSSNYYAQSEVEDPPNRAPSPISTVANWSTVSGTATLGRFPEAPPPYTGPRSTRYANV